jgi:tRNA pseudouridine13 synthase
LSRLPDWSRAFGRALFTGRIRQSPADFEVVEKLDVRFTGSGEHDWLRVRKTGANTHWVAQQLARWASVPVRDTGYAGLKDRHAVTEQWFSVRRSIREPTSWDGFRADGVQILDRQVHNRKLKRGTHAGNSFRIAVRGADAAEPADIEARLERIAAQGVPNYFGEQRFGHDGSNIELGRAVLDGCRVSRHKRGIGLSAIRSLEFNEALSIRVAAGSWNRLLPGDFANLDGSGSVFPVDEITADLERRCAELDVHPCGTLPALPDLRVEAAHRPLRLRVADLAWQVDDDRLQLEFSLGKGSYATAVLRELCDCSAAPQQHV